MARPPFAETARETSEGVFVNGNAAVSKKTLSGGENTSIAASPPDRWAKMNFADGHFRAAGVCGLKVRRALAEILAGRFFCKVHANRETAFGAKFGNLRKLLR